MLSVDVVVIGGGAAGLMCAMTAANRGRRVIVLEGSNKIGKKILMSGGGRCNFTNIYSDPSKFISANPRFCISALSRYLPSDFIDLIEKHGVPFHEKSDGQLFCDNSSKDVLNLLKTECLEANVEVVTHCNVSSVEYKDQYCVLSDKGSFAADSLVIASGGLSIPKMGASDLGYRLALQFGLDVVQTRAGLVPFTFTGETNAMMARLSGVSTNVSLSCDDTTFAGDILITHRGLSGPAALQISSYWQPGLAISMRLVPAEDLPSSLIQMKAERPRLLVRSALAEKLPRALVLELQRLIWPESAETQLIDLSDERLRRIGHNLQEWKLKPAATEGYRTAEVTLGGVDTRQLSSRTMECTHQPGLYFVGEVVDVTGHLGGFNFQWAWASGHAAGSVV